MFPVVMPASEFLAGQDCGSAGFLARVPVAGKKARAPGRRLKQWKTLA
jgi:hypothetical protein